MSDAVTPDQLLILAIKTVILMLVLAVGFRLFGKRQSAQLNVYDLVFIVAISNAVQNGMTGGQGNLWVGIVCSTTIVAGTALIYKAFAKIPGLERKVIGVPTVLVHDGVSIPRNMRKEDITEAELFGALRGHGLERLDQVCLAVLEVDGSISVVPKE